ncbi:hypothetical protein [Liquorilactobacillus capillatus]|uniref:Uncharacterized protein n=1 Tax=Liquorilactobacillus capillatus DSM 19910 TaxID=1423731 RepID=A0A0R1LXV1_9LACO|nr:hypothetical protein [Liquorilactobacillus capillatus]KRL00471.1 hypothetical protein FC81_GL002000 [Liquorilactobacillus capillatus DSM 19910]
MNKNGEQINRRGRNLVKIPSYAISRWLVAALGITLFCAVGAYTLQKTLLNSEFVVPQITKAEYVDEAATTANNVVADLASTNGIPTTLTGNLVTAEQIKQDVTEVVTNLYAGKTDVINNHKIKQQISQNIALKAQNAGISTSNEEFTAVQAALLGSVDNYLNQTLQAEYLDKAATTISSVAKTINAIFWLNVVLTLFFTFILLLHDRSLLRWAHYWGLAALWSGLLMALVVFGINNSGIFVQIAERADQASGLVEKLLETSAVKFQNAGLLLAAGGLVGIIIGLFRKKGRV